MKIPTPIQKALEADPTCQGPGVTHVLRHPGEYSRWGFLHAIAYAAAAAVANGESVDEVAAMIANAATDDEVTP